MLEPARLLAADSAVDIGDLLIPLGPFAITAAVLLLWINDLRKQRDQERDRVQKLSENVIPVLIEVRDVLKGSAETIRGNTEAMNAMVQTVGRSPSESEMTRIRDLLTRLASSRRSD